MGKVHSNGKAPIFAGDDGHMIHDYIIGYEAKYPISKDMVKKAVDCIIRENKLKEDNP